MPILVNVFQSINTSGGERGEGEPVWELVKQFDDGKWLVARDGTGVVVMRLMQIPEENKIVVSLNSVTIKGLKFILGSEAEVNGWRLATLHDQTDPLGFYAAIERDGGFGELEFELQKNGTRQMICMEIEESLE